MRMIRNNRIDDDMGRKGTKGDWIDDTKSLGEFDTPPLQAFSPFR